MEAREALKALAAIAGKLEDFSELEEIAVLPFLAIFEQPVTWRVDSQLSRVQTVTIG